MTEYEELKGHYTIVYSPDDEETTGKGFYADLWWNGETSPLFKTELAANVWAVKRGGHSKHRIA